jgi:membrane fusion protein, multidrug efflux system
VRLAPRSDALAPPARLGLAWSSRSRTLCVLVLLSLAAGGLGARWWLWDRDHVETDNAYVEATSLPLSSRVAGMVQQVFVRDNQFVRRGELLVELDAGDYRIQVLRAEAGVGQAENETSGEVIKAGGADAAVNVARVRLAQAERDLQRAEELFRQDIVARDQVDTLSSAKQTAAHLLQEAEETRRQARASAGLESSRGTQAKIQERRAQLAEARNQLAYTRIVAPFDGYVTRKAVEPGANVQAGQTLLTLVSRSEVWVTANFKEGQLRHISPGQLVTLRADAYPGRSFAGKVDSIMAGAGAAFSLLPPENATGNFVKVVQRIPVKITIDPGSDPEHLLKVGMSVIPTINLSSQ